jgi:excisionase family DNA binding protein
MPAAIEQRWLTPPEVARRIGVMPDKILAWIHSGELRAINAATSLSGRPRYRISPEDLEAFLAARAVMPPPPKHRRAKRRQDGVTEFYGPDGKRQKV